MISPLMENPETRYLMLHGMRIVEDPNLLINGEPETIIRHWKERLFSLPWRPWKKTKIIIPNVPSMEVFQYENYWIMHPVVAAQLKREL